MINASFSSILTKHVIKGGTTPYVEFALQINGNRQDYFLEDFFSEMKIEGYGFLYSNQNYKSVKVEIIKTLRIHFNGIVFDGQLNSISIMKKDDDVKYVLNFIKEINATDQVISMFVKFKEENDEGKEVIREFDTQINLIVNEE